MVDYAFYVTEYGGALPEEEFTRMQGRASAFLASITMGRSEADGLLPWQKKTLARIMPSEGSSAIR